MAKNEIGVLGHISVKITIAIAIAVVALIVILLHIFVPSARKELEFAIAVIGGATAIYAGYYTALSIRMHSERQKRRSSFEALAPLSNIDMAKIRTLVEKEIKPKDISPEELYHKIMDDHNLYSAVNSLLGLFEDISIGIQKDYFDEEVLFYSLGYMVPWYFDGLRHFIDQERKADSYLYWDTEKLATAWRSHKSLMTGKTYEFTC
ncbi:MAG: hypothetical protein KAU17_15130 [Spirochaetales bacterium]|jgi:hypothetical protein|nr:hypothetical protein [Spirochaetales bacterium]